MRSTEMSLEIQAVGRELGELEPATKTWEYSENLERPKKSDAKMR